MKNLDVKAILVTAAAVVIGVAAWEMGIKPLVSKKSASPVIPAGE